MNRHEFIHSKIISNPPISDHQVHLFHEHSSVQVHSTKLELSSVQVQYFSGDNN